MKSLIIASAVLSIATIMGGAQETGKKVSKVEIPLALQNDYLKTSLKFQSDKSALEQTPLYHDLQSTGEKLNAVVGKLRETCGKEYELNIDQDGTPICVDKPKAPAPAAKPEKK